VFIVIGIQPRKHANGEASNKLLSTTTTTSASVSSISRSRSPLSEVVSTRASSVEAEIDPVLLGKRMRDLEEDEGDDRRKTPRTADMHHPVDEATATDWTTALQTLNKGKTALDRQALGHISNVLSIIEDKIEYIRADIIEMTGLKDSIERLSSSTDIPFEDEYGLVHHAGRIMAIWERAVDRTRVIL